MIATCFSMYKLYAMKKFILTPVLVIVFSICTLAQTTYTINISGFSFSPSNLAISVGDKVVFNGSSDHPIAEVSLESWNAEENVPLSGGFSFSSGVGEKTFNMEGTYYYICQNHIGSGMKGKIIVSTTTNLDISFDSEDLKIFPNPLISDNLTVSYSKNISNNVLISIFDIAGRNKVQLSEKLTDNKVVIDCSDLYSGIYFVQINIENRISTIKLVKK